MCSLQELKRWETKQIAPAAYVVKEAKVLRWPVELGSSVTPLACSSGLTEPPVWDHFACGTSYAGPAPCLYEPEGMHFFLVTHGWGRSIWEKQNMMENKYGQICVLRNLVAKETEWPVLVFTVVTMKSVVVWGLLLCSLGTACHFEGAYSLHLQGQRVEPSKRNQQKQSSPHSGGHCSPEHCSLRCFWGWK